MKRPCIPSDSGAALPVDPVRHFPGPGKGVVLQSRHLRDLARFAALLGSRAVGVHGWGLCGPDPATGPSLPNRVTSSPTTVTVDDLRLVAPNGILVDSPDPCEAPRDCSRATLVRAELAIPDPPPGAGAGIAVTVRIVSDGPAEPAVASSPLLEVSPGDSPCVIWLAPALHALACEQTASSSDRLLQALDAAYALLSQAPINDPLPRDAVGRALQWLIRARRPVTDARLDLGRELLCIAFDTLLGVAERLTPDTSRPASFPAVREQVHSIVDPSATSTAKWWDTLAAILTGPHGLPALIGSTPVPCAPAGPPVVSGPGRRVERWQVLPGWRVRFDVHVDQGSGSPAVLTCWTADGPWEQLELVRIARGHFQSEAGVVAPGSLVEADVPAGVRVNAFQIPVSAT